VVVVSESDHQSGVIFEYMSLVIRLHIENVTLEVSNGGWLLLYDTGSRCDLYCYNESLNNSYSIRHRWPTNAQSVEENPTNPRQRGNLVVSSLQNKN
jgi:hypothetical protein